MRYRCLRLTRQGRQQPLNGNTALASNPIALSAYEKGIEGRGEDITPAEHQSLHRSIVGVLHLYDNAHYQYQEGFVSEEFWIATQSSLKGWMRHSAFNAIIMERVEVQGRPEFKAVVRSIDKELRRDVDK